MKHLYSIKIGIVIFMAAALAACGGGGGAAAASGGGAYSMTTLPTKYAVDVPASISGDSGSMAGKSLISTLSILKSDRIMPAGPSEGAAQMKAMTGMMKQMTGMMGFFAVLSDAAISQNSIPADETEHDGPVTLTQGMIDAIADIMPSGMADASSMTSYIGMSMPAKVTYCDNGTDSYIYSVVLSMTSPAGTQIAKIYWNEAKSLTKLELINGANILIFTYDNSVKLMTASMTSADGTMEMSLQETAEGGALFFTNMESGSSIYRMKGYADDIGGYVETTLISGGSVNQSYTEYFDVSGNLTATNTTYDDIYTAGAGEIETLQGEIGFSKAVTGVAAGEYLVLYNSPSVPLASIIIDDVVGYGVVSADGTLIIQDIGGGKYNLLEGTGNIYLYKATGDFMSTTAPTFVDDAVTVAL